MSDRRVSQALVQAEYTDATDNRCVAQVLVQAEYAGATDERRVSQVLGMVEFTIDYFFGGGGVVGSEPGVIGSSVILRQSTTEVL